jgi:hypothetical protein
VDLEDARVVETLDQMERFQPVGHAILNRSGVIQVSILDNNNNMATNGKQKEIPVISGFRRDADEIGALLGCYTVSSGNPLPTFRCNISVSS